MLCDISAMHFFDFKFEVSYQATNQTGSVKYTPDSIKLLYTMKFHFTHIIKNNCEKI